MSIRIVELKKGGCLVDVRLRAPDGRRLRRRVRCPVSSKTGVATWARAFELELLEELLHPKATAPTAPTLEEFSSRWLIGYAEANRHHASGIESKRSILKHHLLPRLGAKRIDAITAEDVQAIKAALGKRSPKTINNVLSTLGTLLKTAVEWRVISEMPCSVRLMRLPRKKPMPVHSHEQYEKLVTKAREVGPETYLIVLLGGDAGLRLGEMMALEWTEVDFDAGRIWVTRAEWNGVVGRPKAGDDGSVPMTDRLMDALRADRHLRGPRVLCHADGRPFNQDKVHNLAERACRLAGLRTDRAVHTLRHTFCTHLAAVAPWRVVQALARHSSASTTEGYVHSLPGDREAAIRALRGTSGAVVDSGNAKSL